MLYFYFSVVKETGPPSLGGDDGLIFQWDGGFGTGWGGWHGGRSSRFLRFATEWKCKGRLVGFYIPTHRKKRDGWGTPGVGGGW